MTLEQKLLRIIAKRMGWLLVWQFIWIGILIWVSL